MKILSHRTYLNMNRLLLEVVTDLGRFTINNEQRLFDEFGLVFCGSESQEILPPVDIPSDPSIGRDGWTATGFTDDPAIVALYIATFRPDK